ncbi:MAG: phage/plasmid primase, P4 family [bacterium]
MKSLVNRTTSTFARVRGGSAIEYAERLGWHLFPVHTMRDGACTCGNVSCNRRGKHPVEWLVPNGYLDATTEVNVLREWWTAEDWNIGLACKQSGVFSLDIDPRHGGDVGLEEIQPLPDSPLSITGSRGQHRLFAAPDGKPSNATGSLPSGIDVRWAGYIILPPSLHASGRPYEWEALGEPYQVKLAAVPAHVLARIRDGSSPSETTTARAPIPEGSRHESLKHLAARLRNDGLGENAIFAALMAENLERCVPPSPEKEVRDLARWAAELQAAHDPAGEAAEILARRSSARVEPEEFYFPDRTLTDTGNAARFGTQHGASIRFVRDLGGWLIWDGTRWRRDDKCEVQELGKATARSLYVEASRASKDAADEIAKHAKKSMSHAGIRAMLALAESLDGIARLPEDFDCDPHAFNVKNGTIDLRTGELRPHAPTDGITKVAGVHWDESAQCPRWQSFLSEIMDGNARLICFLRRAIGYSLTGSVREQALFIAHGSGANGKSTLLETIRALLNDYAKATPAETFLVNRNDSIRCDLAALRGARLVVAQETESGRRLAESLVKQLTGGDALTARHLYREFFTYVPTFKPWLVTNHRPRIVGTDHAIWRRVHLIPFAVTFAPERQDKDLVATLRSELPGILTWAVRGAMEWNAEGLRPPEEVKAATDAYRRDQDTLADFLEERCIVGETLVSTVADLFRAYTTWCESTGERALGSRTFGEALEERGFHAHKGAKGSRLRRGLMLQAVG